MSHLSLWRDIYYINRNYISENNPYWGTPDKVIHLADDEFFVLGDNSPISGDARMWTGPVELPGEDLFVPAGRVPRRFLLGKAFFVYWPAGHRPFSKRTALENPSLPNWSLIPNFGDMRFIH